MLGQQTVSSTDLEEGATLRETVLSHARDCLHPHVRPLPTQAGRCETRQLHPCSSFDRRQMQTEQKPYLNKQDESPGPPTFALQRPHLRRNNGTWHSHKKKKALGKREQQVFGLYSRDCKTRDDCSVLFPGGGSQGCYIEQRTGYGASRRNIWKCASVVVIVVVIVCDRGVVNTPNVRLRGCAKCLGVILIPLSILCILANILLFFPGGTIEIGEHISDEVWYFGGILGSGVLMVFPALVFLGLKNNDCCGCCGNENCGKRFAMFSSIIFAAVGIVGAGYNFAVSVVALNRGPKDYLEDHSLWTACQFPKSIVPWNLTLFSLLLLMSGIQLILCAIQAINGLFGAICGDCKCCGCCGGNGTV
ncbi:Transmembrane 4 L6 family member 4, partial [Ophiophagus hannah]